jgi:hypothetical protein
MAIFKSKTLAAILLVGVILHLNSSPFLVQFLMVSFVASILWLLIQSFRNTGSYEEKYINANGYYVLSRNGELEHRQIAIDLLARNLYDNEVVHHINGRKLDNQIENLCLMDREKHELFHSWIRWKREKSGYYPRFKDQIRILRDEYGGTPLTDIRPPAQREDFGPVISPPDSGSSQWNSKWNPWRKESKSAPKPIEWIAEAILKTTQKLTSD